MRTVLMSIHPQHVASMRAGTKRWEYRRLREGAPWAGRRVVVYETAPVKRITCEFRIDHVVFGPGTFVWDQTHEHAGITRFQFARYFEGREVAIALHVADLTVYAEPVDPHARARNAGERFTAPQSWRYWPPAWWGEP